MKTHILDLLDTVTLAVILLCSEMGEQTRRTLNGTGGPEATTIPFPINAERGGPDGYITDRVFLFTNPAVKPDSQTGS